MQGFTHFFCVIQAKSPVTSALTCLFTGAKAAQLAAGY